jgi:hypothetical protein
VSSKSTSIGFRSPTGTFPRAELCRPRLHSTETTDSGVGRSGDQSTLFSIINTGRPRAVRFGYLGCTKDP